MFEKKNKGGPDKASTEDMNGNIATKCQADHDMGEDLLFVSEEYSKPNIEQTPATPVMPTSLCRRLMHDKPRVHFLECGHFVMSKTALEPCAGNCVGLDPFNKGSGSFKCPDCIKTEIALRHDLSHGRECSATWVYDVPGNEKRDEELRERKKRQYFRNRRIALPPQYTPKKEKQRTPPQKFGWGKKVSKALVIRSRPVGGKANPCLRPKQASTQPIPDRGSIARPRGPNTLVADLTPRYAALAITLVEEDAALRQLKQAIQADRNRKDQFRVAKIAPSKTTLPNVASAFKALARKKAINQAQRERLNGNAPAISVLDSVAPTSPTPRTRQSHARNFDTLHPEFSTAADKDERTSEFLDEAKILTKDYGGTTPMYRIFEEEAGACTPPRKYEDEYPDLRIL